MIARIILTLLLLNAVNCYFRSDAHKENVANILKSFIKSFQSKFSTITFGELDWHSKMELAFDYWVTSFKVRDLRKIEFDYETDWNGIVIFSPELFIDIIIEESYLIPVKLTNFKFQIVLYSDDKNLQVNGVQIDVEDISLDLNLVVSYLSKQLLSLDLVRDAIKSSEIPIRNLLAKAMSNNRERLVPVLMLLENTTTTDTDIWVDLIVKANPHAVAKGEEFYLGTRGLFNLESVRQTKDTDL